MFKGSIRIYKNISGKEECVNKEFDNEKDFDKFIIKNPDLKSLNDWESLNIPDSLFDLNEFFENALSEGNTKFFKEMEKDLDILAKKGKKLLGK